MDLAADAAGARATDAATRMSLLWAAWSSWRTWARATVHSDPALSGLNDHTTTRAGSGPTRQSDARDSDPLLVSVAGARAGYLLL